MKKKFMIINISWDIIEMILICTFFYFLSNKSVTILMMAFGLTIFMYLLLTFKILLKNPFGKSLVDNAYDNLDEKYQDMFKQAELLKGSKIDFKYVNFKQLINSAFYFNSTVYINTHGNVKGDYFEGLLAHELGHAVSGFGDYSWVMSYRFSTLVSNLVLSIRNRITYKRKKVNKILDNITYPIIRLLGFVDIFTMYPYIYAEEFKANEIALKLSDGHALRTYYYSLYKRRKFKHNRFDLKHPPVDEMIYKMESLMNLTEYQKDVYHIGNKIYFVTNAKRNKDISIKKHLFYQHVATHDDVEVLVHLSNNYLKGIGTSIDYDKAIEYSLKSVELGYDRGYINLALISEKLDKYDDSLYYLNRAKELELKNVDRILNRVLKKIESIKEEGIIDENN